MNKLGNILEVNVTFFRLLDPFFPSHTYHTLKQFIFVVSRPFSIGWMRSIIGPKIGTNLAFGFSQDLGAGGLRM